MRGMRFVAVGGVLGVMFASGTASGAVISPTGDTYVSAVSAQQATNYDNPNPGVPLSTAGLLNKNQTGNQRVSFIQYTIPTAPVLSATFNIYYYASWNTSNNWLWHLEARVDSFDETRLVFNDANAVVNNHDNYSGSTLQSGPFTNLMPGGDVTLLKGTGTNVFTPPVLQTIDITTYLNGLISTNPGGTVVFKSRSTSGSGTDTGGTFEDREGSRTGNLAYAPYIEFQAVPEPAAMLLLLSGLPMLRRRRSAN